MRKELHEFMHARAVRLLTTVHLPAVAGCCSSWRTQTSIQLRHHIDTFRCSCIRPQHEEASFYSSYGRTDGIGNHIAHANCVCRGIVPLDCSYPPFEGPWGNGIQLMSIYVLFTWSAHISAVRRNKSGSIRTDSRFKPKHSSRDLRKVHAILSDLLYMLQS